MSDNWLQPQRESEDEKAERKRRAKEEHRSIYDVVNELDAMQSKPKSAAPPKQPAGLPRQQRIDPEAIIEGEEPRPVSELPTPRVLGEPAPPPSAAATSATRPDPDPRLVEIARTWSWLSERDREELQLLVRVKAHLNQKAAGK